MNYKLAICDDEPAQISHLEAIVRRWAEESGHSCDISAFSSAENFLFEYGQGDVFDILLLDIEMRGMSGIDLAKRLREKGCRREIVFITSHFEFYGEGYEVDALHYLLKPVDADKLSAVLTKATGRLASAPPSIIFQTDGETVRLREEDILYIESLLHYLVIRTETGEYKFKGNLSVLAEQLSADFYRPHRSYLISLKHVTRISRTSVTLDDRIQIPLSRGKYDDINRAFIERH